ncbi:ABC transporter permease [Streptosporangium sp. CA-135522]|uniref:ABC transporter permease n=1 Tax=Streptosporangium sp. CA-135522 TaxID=3240072 RepID=UPI003D8B923B
MNSLIGTGALIRLALRRERVMTPLWIALLVVMTVGQVKRYAQTFPTTQAIADFAAEMGGNRALIAFGGEIYSPTLGGMTVWKIADIVYTLIGLMAVLTVVRHTRAEEESGRAELVGSAVVGRFAALTASLVVTCAASLLTGLVIALGMTGAGLDATGSLALGIGMTVPGLIFAGVAAVTTQLTERARTATALASGVLAVSYVLRFVADGSGQEWIKWLSPQGWSHLIRPYADERWTPLALGLSVALLTIAVAYRLAARRDLGTGLIPQRPGPATAAPGLRSPLALAWRLQRGLLLGWTTGFAVMGVFFGGLAATIPEVAGEGASIQEFFRRYAGPEGSSLTDAYLWLIALSLGYTAALYPALATLRLRGEESTGHTEMLLATPVGRLRLAASHLVFAALGPVAVLAAAGLTMGLATGDTVRVLGATLVQVPAVWTVGGVAVLAFGLLPRLAAAISWGAFLFVNLFGEVLGPILGMDYWIANTAVPFHHLPKILSGGEFAATPIVALTAVAALLCGAGLLAYRRRDIV